MRVPVCMEGNSCGFLSAVEKGLYCCFRANVQFGQISRLYAVFEEGEIPLGIPVPEDRNLTLRISIPISRLPTGQLIRGELRPLEYADWVHFPGGKVGGQYLPRGLKQGNRYRFPWVPGDPLPCDAFLCFYRYSEENGKGYLELAFDDGENPVV